MRKTGIVFGCMLGVFIAISLALVETPKGHDSFPKRNVQRPNIVLIVTDDQRADTLSTMPTVQAEIAAKGVSFVNAFVSNPLCCPSRASILTGNYSHTTGVYGNGPPHGGFPSFNDSSTLATWLDKAGYNTAFIGKYLNGYGHYGGKYVPPGWDEWVAFAKHGYLEYALNVNGRIIGNRTGEIGYSTDRLSKYAARFIRRATNPFFLVFAPFAPHEPAQPPPRHRKCFIDQNSWTSPAYNEKDVSDKPAYVRRLSPSPQRHRTIQYVRHLQMCSLLAVDDAIRRIIAELKRTDQLENTLIIYTSDNGVAWGEHRLGHFQKLVPYDGVIRVPFIVRYDPLTSLKQRAVQQLVLNIDIAPTIAKLASIQTPSMEGRSLLPLLRGGTRTWRHDFLLEHLRGNPQPDIPTYCGVRNRRYTYVLYETGEEELYDHQRDPHELNNLANDPTASSLTQTLRQRVYQLCNPPPPGYSPKRSK